MGVVLRRVGTASAVPYRGTIAAPRGRTMARSHPLSQLPRRARWPLGPAGVSPAGPTEYEVLVATPSYLREALARFEQRYGMSSEEFLRRDAAGELDDREDFCEWY